MKKLFLTVMLFTVNLLVYSQFTCNSSMYLGQTPNAATNTTLYGVNTSTNPFTYPAIGTVAAVKYNAMGFNPLDGYIYAMSDSSNNILKINSDGTYSNLGAVTNLPGGVSYNAGEIDGAGNFYVSASGTVNTLYRINLTTLTSTAIPLQSSIAVSDFAFNPTNNTLYGVHNSTGVLTRINPANGAVVPIGTASAGTPFGAMIGSSTGAIYGVSNGGGFYQFNINTGSRVLISGSPASQGNDGAHCVTAPITFGADLSVTKTNGTTTYTPGTATTYTIVVRNNGPFGVLNASVADNVPAGIPSANMTYTAVASAGSTTTVTGTQTGAINDLVSLPVNGTITYTATVNIPVSFTGNLSNTATVSSSVTSNDPDLSNNSATDTDVLPTCLTGVDSDGDGINDPCDLDDDNDGILDTVECPPTYLVRPVVTSSITANKPITEGSAQELVNGEGAGATGAGPSTQHWYTLTSNLPIAFTMNMQAASTIDHIKLYGPWGIDEWIRNFRVELYNSSNVLLGTENLTAPDQYTGTPILSFSQEYSGVTRIRFTIISGQGYNSFGRASVNEIVFLDLQPMTCDTDGDGIPDHLDLDSDNDGCPDALEGDENVELSQLNPDGSINISANGGVNPDGVPNLVNSGGVADIGGDQGQGAGVSKNGLFNDCEDIDEDGIPDYLDLDDDNDGILDVNEECNGFKAQMTTGSWIGTTSSTLTVSIPGTSPRTNSGTDIILSQYPFHFNQNGAGQRYNKGGNMDYTFTFSTPVPASEIAFGFGDLQSSASTVAILVNDGIPNGTFVAVGGNSQPYYNVGTGIFIAPNSSSQNLLLMGATDALISTITIVSTGIGSSDLVDFTFYGHKICDTDSDNIANKLDLDSDGDGCPDSVEGDENVELSQLNPDGSINISANGGVDANGVPNLVNSGGAADIGGDQGQGAGFSQSAIMNECDAIPNADCTEPGATGTPLSSSVGILTKEANLEGWPEDVPNGYLVLDSAEKGFVITHMTTAERDLLTPLEGMMIYNTTENCVQLYRGTSPTVDSGRTGWNCIEQSCGDIIAPRNVQIGYWSNNGYNFFSNHGQFRSQLENTSNYGNAGIFQGITGWDWINATTDVNATEATFSAAQLKGKYDIIVTGWQEMSAASASKIKQYTDLGGVVFVLMDAGEGVNLNIAFGGGTIPAGVNNAPSRSLDNQISNGLFGNGGNATITGAQESSLPAVTNLPPGSFILGYVNNPDATSTTNASVYITGAEGRAIFVYDEGIFRHASVSGTVIDTAQERFIHNLMVYALEKVGFSAQ